MSENEEKQDDAMENFISKIVFTDRIQVANEIISALDIPNELKAEHHALCARMVQSLSQ